ncbi:MAG TPA: hypothetical protein VGB24_23490 [Longimicrobium sp.]|jgi:hypothetical protein|uniref:hypothetical protein n=1 Tax=Longimicrobium sp. TaxID=2029185 RepID=UPI002EDABEA2
MSGAAETLHPVPARGVVAREALRAVGQSVRLEVGAVLALLLGLLVLMATVQPQGAGGADYDVSDMTWPVVILGLFAPLAVWKHDEPSRRAYLWSLPVERARHTLAKVASGWTMLMGLVAAYVLWAMTVALVTDGNITINPEWEAALRPTLPPDARIRDLTLSGHPWLWLVPFTAATTTYLLGSILALLADHPLRVVAGAGFAFFVAIGLLESTGGAAEHTADSLFVHLVTNPYGIVTEVTGVVHRFDTGPGVLNDQPNLGAWARATLLWMGAGLAATVLAARRYQER